MTRKEENLGPPLSIYRASCVAILRRYFQMSVELGRLPSLVGREVFRSSLRTIQEAWFEDAVIFVHDVESCLEKLHHFDQQVLARVIFQEYTRDDAARLLGCAERHLRRRLAIALDVLSQLFLDRKLMILATPSHCERIVEDLSAAAATDSTDELVSRRYKPTLGEWQEVPVEISCQAPAASQFAASC